MTTQEQIEQIIRGVFTELPHCTRCAGVIVTRLIEADLIADKWRDSSDDGESLFADYTEQRLFLGIWNAMERHFTTRELREDSTVERTIFLALLKNDAVKLKPAEAT